MATTTGDIGEQESVSKTVTILGYAPGKFDTFREWADEFDGSRDYFAMTTNEYTNYYLNFPGGRLEMDEDEFEDLKDVDLGDASVTAETTEKTAHSVSKTKFSRMIRSDLLRDLPDEVAGYEQGGLGNNQWRNSDGDNKVKIYRYAEEMPLLRHQSDIQPDDMYVDPDEEYPAVKLKIKVMDIPSEKMDEIDDKLIGKVMELLGRHSAVGRVRIAECEQQTKQKGVCLNI